MSHCCVLSASLPKTCCKMIVPYCHSTQCSFFFSVLPQTRRKDTMSSTAGPVSQSFPRLLMSWSPSFLQRLCNHSTPLPSRKCKWSARWASDPLLSLWERLCFLWLWEGQKGTEKISAIWLGNMVWVPQVSLDIVSNPGQLPWCISFYFTQLCCDGILPLHSLYSFMPQSCSSITAIKFRHTHHPDKILDILSCLTSDSPPSSAPSLQTSCFCRF